MDFKKIIIGLNVIVFFAVIIHYNTKQELSSEDFKNQIEASNSQMEVPEAQEEELVVQMETSQVQAEEPEVQIENPISSLESYVNQILNYEFENTIVLLSGFDAARKSLYHKDVIDHNDRQISGFVRFKDLLEQDKKEPFNRLNIKYYSVEHDQLTAFYMEPVYKNILVYDGTDKKGVSPEYYVVYAPDGKEQVENFVEYVKYSALYPNEYQTNEAFYAELDLLYPKILKLNDSGWYFVFLNKVLVR